MYRWLVRRALEWMLADLRRGRTRVFVKLLADDVRFRFPGDHSWAADDQGKEAVARWLERYVRTGLRLYPREIVVSGPPWNIRSAPGSSMRPVGTTARLSIATKGCSSTGSCAGASRNTSPSRTPRRPPSSTPTCAAPGRFEAPMAAGSDVAVDYSAFRHRPGYGFFNLRQPPARLLAMTCLSNALSAWALICSPSL